MRPAIRGVLRALCAAALLLAALNVSADVRVPAGATLRLEGGRIDLGSGSYAGQGALVLGAGELGNLDDFRVLAGGSADLGDGSVRLAGDWENRGAITATTARVDFIDGPGDSFVLGATGFADFRVATSVDKRIVFETGSTQRFTGLLTLTGSGAPLRIAATAPPAPAFLQLLPSGSQNIANVAVSDVHGTGQLLAPGQTNQGGNANTRGWFGLGAFVNPAVIPSSSTWSLLSLALLLVIALAARRGWREALTVRRDRNEA